MAAFSLALLRCCFVRPSAKSEANCRKAERARLMVRRGRPFCFGVSKLEIRVSPYVVIRSRHVVAVANVRHVFALDSSPFHRQTTRRSPRASPFCRSSCSRSAFGSEKACPALGIKKDGETVHVSPSRHGQKVCSVIHDLTLAVEG